jgi:hypothetical protein
MREKKVNDMKPRSSACKEAGESETCTAVNESVRAGKAAILIFSLSLHFYLRIRLVADIKKTNLIPLSKYGQPFQVSHTAGKEVLPDV